jgi:hypothetical protein
LSLKQEDIFIANRRFEQFSYSLIKKKTEIEGVASLSAAGAVLSQDIPGATLTKTGVGAYLLTLQDKYNTCLGIYPQLAETDQDLQAVPGAADVSSAKTIVINTKTEGVNTDPSATAKLYVKVVLRNSSVL